MSENHKLYLTIARKVATQNEATMLGITLGISHDDVRYNVINHDIRDVVYKFLCWAEDIYPPEEKWQKIIEAL